VKSENLVLAQGISVQDFADFKTFLFFISIFNHVFLKIYLECNATIAWWITVKGNGGF
jgi:hypothetical protein